MPEWEGRRGLEWVFQAAGTGSIVCKSSIALIRGWTNRDEKDWTQANFFSAFMGSGFLKEIETRCSFFSQNIASQSTPGKGTAVF